MTSCFIAVFLSFTLISFLAAFSQNIVISGYKTYWYTQNINHFNPQNVDTFEQRWLINSSNWNSETGVIFFYAGNEGPIDGFWNNTGLMFQWASQFNAMVIAMEHRYYGQSLPFGINTFSNINNLRYLTLENAIADYAVFLTWFKTEYNIEENTPVIVFGGSYGGILATLCRIHYPAIFDIALAASAPIPQTLDTINGSVFFQIVTDDYYNSDPSCVDIVRQGFAQLLNAGQNNNYNEIRDVFNLCPETKMDSAENVTYLELWARNAFLTMAMVDYPYAADFLGDMPAWPVNYTCKNILLSSEYATAMDALSAAAGFYYNASAMNGLTCHDITSEYIYCADQTGCGIGTDAIAWDYQMCTQIVYDMNTNNVTDMFPVREWEWPQLVEYCNETYGVIPEPKWMQIWFPLNVEKVGSNIIFSNGLIDPWHGGGYLSNLSASMPAVIIPLGAHHLDLRGRHEGDTEDVIQARKLENEYIVEWLADMDKARKPSEVSQRVVKS